MISAPGIGSGLDVSGIISKLMEIEQQPLTQLNTKEAKQQAQLSAFGSLKSVLSTFQDSVKALAKPALFNGYKATLADTTAATVSTSSSAAAGTHDIEVQSLAQAQKIKSEAFATTDTVIGSGTLTIEFGTYNEDGTFTANAEKAAKTITIDPAKSTLADIRSAINEANAGVTASIVNDGSGNRLVISSKDSGLANALKISVDDTDGNHTDNAGLSKLAFDASTGGVSNMTETVAARNAVMVIDGITVTKSSNTINDALEGVTFNLLKANPGTTTTLTVEKDKSSVEAAVNAFVKAYNDLEKTIGNLSRYDAANKQASVLTGDSTVRMIQNRMRAMLNGNQSAAGGINSLSELGISFQKDGTLALDNNKLSAVLNNPDKNIAAFFGDIPGATTTSSTTSQAVNVSDSLISIINQPPTFTPGSLAVNISQLATQGSATGSKVAELSINSILFPNNVLNLIIDGVSANITLASGNYTAVTLAAEIQSKINNNTTFSNAGVSVAVTQNAGKLSITSSRYGSASSVQITGGNGKDNIFGTPAQTAGQNVAGTIGGQAATGSGKELSSNGLTLKIDGGSTGNRGTVDFVETTTTTSSTAPSTPGFITQLDQLITGMTRSDGLISSRMDGINSTIKGIGKQREALEFRLESVEKRLRAQFTALDTMIASMNQTSNYLQQQLANLPKIGE
ncbi:flagellar filament capping protein FliD [Nitrosomonas sp. H1_AOB3]|uniref:flagellar filament capping protein FliD n=2 Tax=Nitrosomonas TaxID=914 RepID=UPI001936E7EA|nr:flagellar filament capping protein FliD [Nitrosomonas sp. H1_AOB3]QOJ08430.1 MAG: flagellar filament capping protein FliD [Nitrosomonas sp. H1_AOB3]